MKIPAIKSAVEKYTIQELKEAESALYEELSPTIHIDGDDEGEKLTHILAAIWIKEQMEKTSEDFKTTLRKYTQRVRNSIN